MIDISERAQAHFLRLLSQQGDDDLGIRLRVVDAGTPSAQCELEFCSRAELSGDEWTVECEGFNLYVDGESMRWLDPANIDYETTPTGSQLNIRAPRIKGEAPGEGAGLAVPAGIGILRLGNFVRAHPLEIIVAGIELADMVETEPAPVARTVETGSSAGGRRRAKLARLVAAGLRAGGAALLDPAVEFGLTLTAARH